MRHVLVGLASVACAAAVPAPAATLHFAAVLKGDAEVPAVKAAGAGTLSADLNTATRRLRYRLVYSGLTGPAEGAHFHGPAGPATNAPHLLMIGTDEHQATGNEAAALASPVAGAAILTLAQMADLRAGRWYVNVHTKAHPGGEIRGQLLQLR